MMNMDSKKLLMILCCLASIGCAEAQSSADVNDPFQNYNRHMYTINDTIDRAVFKPIATLYQTVTPSFMRTGVTNFFNNLDSVPTVVNDALQGNSYAVGRDSWRFMINSTVGVGGLLDPASKFGLPHNEQDFGLTLGKWGYTSSTYIVLPIFGPSTVRDTIALPVDYMGSVYPYVGQSMARASGAADAVNERANGLQYDNERETAFDP
jgi:phospholipid-binding lipoprotein MlaA